MSAENIKTLLWTYLALMALLALTAGSAFIEMGIFNPILNIGIAAAKTILIVLFFMHLKSGSSVVRLAAGAGFFWLLLLFGLSLSDYLSRF